MGSLARRWWLGLVLAVVGLAAGIAGGAARSAVYTSEVRLVVGNQDLTSFEVPGFALASQELASDYARYVDNTSVATSGLDDALGPAVGSLTSVSASPIADSNVVSVEVSGTDRAATVTAASSIAQKLVSLTRSTTTASQAELLERYQSLTSQAQSAQGVLSGARKALSRAQTGDGSVAAARQTVARATVVAESLLLQKMTAGVQYQDAVTSQPAESQLSVVVPAAIIGSDYSHVIEVAAVAGLVAGVVLALLASVWLERRRVRLTTPATSSPPPVTT